MNFPQQTDPVCCRCVKPVGEEFVTVHRNGDRQAVAVCHVCASPKELREQAERRASGSGW